MTERLEGQRFVAQFATTADSVMRDGGTDYETYEYKAYWWSADAFVMDRETGETRFCRVHTAEQRNQPREFLREALGDVWPDRVVDRKKFIDAVCRAIFTVCQDMPLVPLPEVLLTVGTPEQFHKPLVDVGRLIENGTVLQGDGQRSLPLAG